MQRDNSEMKMNYTHTMFLVLASAVSFIIFYIKFRETCVPSPTSVVIFLILVL